MSNFLTLGIWIVIQILSVDVAMAQQEVMVNALADNGQAENVQVENELVENQAKTEHTTRQQVEEWLTHKIETSLIAQFPNSKNIDIRIRLPSSIKSLPVCPFELAHDLKSELTEQSYLGKESWRIYCGDLWSIRANSTVRLEVEVVVSTKPIKKNHRLVVEDLKLEWITLSHQQPIYQNIQTIIGRKMRRSIPNNKPITSQYLQFEVDINKGDLVVIVYQSEAIRVETKGIALTSGVIGDTIRVENQNSGKQLSVEVIDKTHVRHY